MEKFTVDLDAVLDEFEFHEEQVRDTDTSPFNCTVPVPLRRRFSKCDNCLFDVIFFLILGIFFDNMFGSLFFSRYKSVLFFKIYFHVPNLLII